MKTLLLSSGTTDLGNLIKRALIAHDIHVETVNGSQDLLSRISGGGTEYSLLLLDSEAENGVEDLKALRRLQELRLQMNTIVLANDSEQSGTFSAEFGGKVLQKPISLENLVSAISETIEPGKEANNPVQERRGSPSAQEDFPATATWSQRIESLLVRIASSNVPVLLQGETGAGKEVIARKLHALSRRADRSFVKLNCAALPSELVESELFGYERGAFTGALKNTPGKFEMAHKGTILLDEIGDMDFRLQAKLLQVLQDNEFYRLGAHEPSRIDVRIMAASHCDFEKAIADRKFREDLYYRLNIVDIKIPPLRERRNEILPLCEVFLQKHATTEWPKLEIDPILRQVLLEYNWPGNVRELENAMRKYLVLRNPGVLAAEIRQRTVKTKTVYVPAEEYAKSNSGTAESYEDSMPMRRSTDLPRWKAELGKSGSDPAYKTGNLRELGNVQELPRPTLVSRSGNPQQEIQPTLTRVNEARKMAEAEAILAALQASLWNRKRAAVLLNVDYKALLYKMKKLGIGEKQAATCG